MKAATRILTYWIIVAVDAMLVMFALAAFDHPVAYWKALLGTYAFASVIGTGIYNGVLKTVSMFSNEIKGNTK